mgnify:CR=1 FL=1
MPPFWVQPCFPAVASPATFLALRSSRTRVFPPYGHDGRMRPPLAPLIRATSLGVECRERDDHLDFDAALASLMEPSAKPMMGGCTQNVAHYVESDDPYILFMLILLIGRCLLAVDVSIRLPCGVCMWLATPFNLAWGRSGTFLNVSIIRTFVAHIFTTLRHLLPEMDDLVAEFAELEQLGAAPVWR